MKRYPQRVGEPLTRICAGPLGCHEERWIEEFRILSTGHRSTYCMDCEAEHCRQRKRTYPLPEFIPIEDVAEVLVG